MRAGLGGDQPSGPEALTVFGCLFWTGSLSIRIDATIVYIHGWE